MKMNHLSHVTNIIKYYEKIHVLCFLILFSKLSSEVFLIISYRNSLILKTCIEKLLSFEEFCCNSLVLVECRF